MLTKCIEIVEGDHIVDTDFGKTLRWIQDMCQFNTEEWKDGDDEMVTINIDNNYIKTYGCVGITFRNGKFDGFEVYE